MGWYFSPYALVLFACALVTAGLSVYAWRQRAQVSIWPALTLIGITIWTAGYAVAIGVHDLPGRILWAKVQHIGIALTPVAMAAFVLDYTGYERWLTRRNLALLALVPAVGMALAWTNELHGLIWAHVELRIVGPLALLDLSYGPYFWFYFAYNYLVLLGSIVVFFRAALRAPHLQRRQAVIMLVGVLCPGVAIALYLSGLNPFPYLDLAPLGYSLGGLVLAYGLFRHHLFDLVPVARDKVLENMDDGVLVIVDAPGRVADANPAMLRLIGRPAREVIGRPIAQVLSDQLDLIERYRDRPEAHDEISFGEGDARRYFDLHISPLYGRKKQLIGRVVVLRDITGRRRGEEERERLIGELDAFAHTVAHDLKAPLSAVIGYTELLEGELSHLPPAQHQQYLRALIWTGDKMANIIDELLLLASMRKETIQVQVLDMGSIVAEALRRLAYILEEARAQVIQPPDWPAALGYAPWVEEVWVNYLGNALKYGGRPPRVELGADVQAEGRVRFWVRDNGPGIAAEDQARLFVPFTQLGRVHATGQGLGLSIVRRIADRLGGQVGVESVAGQGSLFYFTLPGAAHSPAAPGPDRI